jgi:hypothetical protein
MDPAHIAVIPTPNQIVVARIVNVPPSVAEQKLNKPHSGTPSTLKNGLSLLTLSIVHPL